MAAAIGQAVDRKNISAVAEIIRPHVRRTPVLQVDGAEFGLEPMAITLKLELLQHSGSFKARGAFTNLLTRDIPDAGVVAASGGNHGAAVAYAAHKLGIPARIFVPTASSPAKIKRIESFGADLVVGGDLYNDALLASEAWVAHSGALAIHAYDQTETLLGQGTTALEFEDQAPDLDTVLVSVGGGGFIGGIAAWYAGTATNVVGIEPEAAPTLHLALAAGEPVDAPGGGIAADSLAPRQVGKLMFEIAKDHVDHVTLVTDDDIITAQQLIWDVVRVVAEPGGAAALAALISDKYKPEPNERVGVLVCGSNTVAVDFSR